MTPTSLDNPGSAGSCYQCVFLPFFQVSVSFLQETFPHESVSNLISPMLVYFFLHSDYLLRAQALRSLKMKTGFGRVPSEGSVSHFSSV